MQTALQIEAGNKHLLKKKKKSLQHIVKEAPLFIPWGNRKVHSLYKAAEDRKLCKPIPTPLIILIAAVWCQGAELPPQALAA